MRFLVWGIPCGFQTKNFIWGFQHFIWYISPWPGMLQSQSIQLIRQDVAIDFLSNPVLRWIMSCVSKPSCTHITISSICLIYHIQCGFSISYLYIPRILAHDRCNISQIVTSIFNFNFQYCAVRFIYITVFQDYSKRGSLVEGWVGRAVGS